MIGIIDLKISNIASVSKALKFLKIPHKIGTTPEELEDANKLILPGVGNFAVASKKLHGSGMGDFIEQKVEAEKTPILGICLGMQLLASKGMEGGESPGLGLIKGRVEALPNISPFRLPHMGWNNTKLHDSKLFAGVAQDSDFYFVHSYHLVAEEEVGCSYSNHGHSFIAAIEKGCVYGTQFHPEKSQSVGLKILENFGDTPC